MLLGLLLLPLDPAAGERKPRPVAAREMVKSREMRVREVRRYEGRYVVLLQTMDDKVVMPIWIGESEAQAIQLRLLNQKTPRPLTHALLESVLVILRARVVRVEVNDIRENVFIGQLELRGEGGKRYLVDGRPSDLITLAVGASLPVHVASHVLREAGVDISGDKPEPLKPPEEDSESQESEPKVEGEEPEAMPPPMLDGKGDRIAL